MRDESVLVHCERESKRAFDEVVAAFEKAVGLVEGKAFEKTAESGLRQPAVQRSVVQHTEFCRTENRNDLHLALRDISRTKGQNLIGHNDHQST